MIINPKYPKAVSRKEMLRFVTNKHVTSLEVGCREAFFSKTVFLTKNNFKTLTVRQFGITAKVDD